MRGVNDIADLCREKWPVGISSRREIRKDSRPRSFVSYSLQGRCPVCSPTARVQRGPSDSLYLYSREWARLPFTARIERPPLHRGGSASKKGTWPLFPQPSEAARCASTGDQQATSPSFQARLFHSLWNGTRVGSTAAVERGPFTFLNLSLGEWPRLPSTARIGRAPFHRARSASREGTWPLPATPSQRPERPFKKLLSEGHMLLDVCLQFARACFPVVSRIADAAAKTDKLL
jgi:hypothetical protein